MERLYPLLGAQTKKYLAGDSTSVTVETAQELLASLLYTLRIALAEAGRPDSALLTADLAELLQRGQRILQDRLTAAKRLWEQACLTAPPIKNVFYEETLKELGAFFHRYDLWYFAHQIPCLIDYPLCVPVPDEAQGVSCVEQWLRRLLIENWLLSRFPEQAVAGLLAGISADYQEYLLNLCEQPVVNALGLALLGKPAHMPEMSAGDCARLQKELCARRDIAAELDRAAASVSSQFSAPEEAADYLRAIAAGMRPHLLAALSAGNLGGVFLAGNAQPSGFPRPGRATAPRSGETASS